MSSISLKPSMDDKVYSMHADSKNPETILDGPRLLPTSGAVRHMIVFLHGYGANGADLISIGHLWQPFLPDTLFFAPDGLKACLHEPSYGRQWFDLHSLDPDYIAQGLRAAAPLVHASINHELAKNNLTGADLALVGFSQGTMLALHMGVSDTNNPMACHPRAIVGYSGIFIDQPSLPLSHTNLPEILLIHGSMDTVIPSQALMDSVSRFQAHGVSCEWHLSPDLGHGIDDAGLKMGATFLKKSWQLS